MTDLRTHKLSDLYSISSGLSSTKDQAGHGAPFVSYSDVYNNFFLPADLSEQMDTSLAEQQKHSVRYGDVFLTRTSETLDELAISSVALKDYPQATFSGFTKRLRPKEEGIVDPRFMGFFLRSGYFRKIINNVTTMTTRASFNETIFSHITVRLPDFDTQQAIGSLLFTVEEKIRINDSLLNTLSRALRTVYDYWFSQFDFPDENSAPYRKSGGQMTWSPELNKEIPKGWRVARSEILFTGIRTGLNPRQHFQFQNSGIAYLTVKNLTSQCTLDLTKTDFISNEAALRIRQRSDLQSGDILFASIAPLGRCYLIHDSPKDWEINESLFSIRPNTSETSPAYLFSYLSSEWFIKRAEKSSTGSVFKGIRQDTLKSMPTLVPPFSVAQNYAKVAMPMLERKHRLELESRKLAALRNWLIPMVVSGQVKPKDNYDF